MEENEQSRIRVLIADDEARICKLIAALVDWDALGMQLVGTASNGVEAIAAIERTQPELLITDIRMPGCDGLELIRQAREQQPGLLFIIISGYTQFEYAQLAIKYGVSDYLLKPIDRQELTAALGHIRAELTSRRQAQALSDRMRRSLYSGRRKVRACYLTDILNQRKLELTLDEINEEYRYSFRDERFIGFAVKLMGAQEDCGDVRSFLLSQLRSASIDAELSFEPESGTGTGVVNFRADAEQQVLRCLDGCLRQLQQTGGAGSRTVCLAAGPAAELGGLPDSVLTARRLLDERFVRGGSRVLTGLPELAGLPIMDLLADFLRRLAQALEQEDKDAVRRTVSRLQESAQQEPGTTGRELLKLVLLAGEKVLETHGDDAQNEPALSAFRARCAQCVTADQLFGALEQFLCALAERLSESRMNDELLPLRQAQKFLEQHYMENISLEQVAGLAGFNPSYFSVLFKKKCGVGFQDYLTAIRIRHAKELLTQGGVPVLEVCYAVGYKDVKHFNRVFKRATNLRPSEFKRLYGR